MATQPDTTATTTKPATSSVVVPIRANIAVPAENRDEDLKVVMFSSMARKAERKTYEMAQTDECGSEAHRQFETLTRMAESLPCNNLRCLVSTGEMARDFELRCLEAETVRAEHKLNSLRIEQLEFFEGVPWWESATQAHLVEENHKRWETYRARLLDMAETPAATRPQAERKRRLIGATWLRPCRPDDPGSSYYDRLRAGVAADEARFPRKPKRGGR